MLFSMYLCARVSLRVTVHISIEVPDYCISQSCHRVSVREREGSCGCLSEREREVIKNDKKDRKGAGGEKGVRQLEQLLPRIQIKGVTGGRI